MLLGSVAILKLIVCAEIAVNKSKGLKKIYSKRVYVTGVPTGTSNEQLLEKVKQLAPTEDIDVKDSKTSRPSGFFICHSLEDSNAITNEIRTITFRNKLMFFHKELPTSATTTTWTKAIQKGITEFSFYHSLTDEDAFKIQNLQVAENMKPAFAEFPSDYKPTSSNWSKKGERLCLEVS